MTFIEQAKGSSDKSALLDQALKEFEKLHDTPAGPLEYLGKALVYQTLNDEEEETKCFEIAYRRYPKHPLLLILQEQILSRMHEVSRQQRITTYRFILLTIRHFPASALDTHTRRLFTSLQKYWEILPFIEEQHAPHTLQMLRFAIPLAFWLAKPYILEEILDDLLKYAPPSTIEMGNALSCLIELGAWHYAENKIAQLEMHTPPIHGMPWEDLKGMLACHQQPLKKVFQNLFARPFEALDYSQMRTLLYAMDQAIDSHQPDLVHGAMSTLEHCELSFEARLRFNVRQIWAFLAEKNGRKQATPFMPPSRTFE